MILKWILNRMGGHWCSHLDEDRDTVMSLWLIYIKCREFLDSWGTVNFSRTLLHGANLHNFIYKGLAFHSHSSHLIQIHLFLAQFSNAHLNIIIPLAHLPCSLSHYTSHIKFLSYAQISNVFISFRFTAQVQSQASSCGICGGPSGTGTGFFSVLQFSPLNIIPPKLHTQSSVTSTI
jgi:hypothetical protein